MAPDHDLGNSQIPQITAKPAHITQDTPQIAQEHNQSNPDEMISYILKTTQDCAEIAGDHPQVKPSHGLPDRGQIIADDNLDYPPISNHIP